MDTVGSNGQIPAPLRVTDIAQNRLHFRFRCARIPGRFRFEVSMYQLIFNLDFQPIDRLLTLSNDILQSSFVLGMAVRTGLWEVVERVANLMIGIEFAIGVLHFRHVTVDAGHIVFAVNADAPGFIFRMLRFQHRCF